MDPAATSGFTLWLRAVGKQTAVEITAEEIARELEHRGLSVEVIDAARMARQAYVSKSSAKGVSLAISMTVDALNRHGIAALIHGAKSSTQDFAWHKRKPERLLDIVCLAEGETVTGKGPYLTLRPVDLDDATNPPDPPSTARVEDEARPAEASSDPNDPELAQKVVLFDTRPLFDALAKAGWVASASVPTNGDDELLRNRLKNLGYL